MPLTRDFKKTIRARASRDAKFRKELLREGIEVHAEWRYGNCEDHPTRLH